MATATAATVFAFGTKAHAALPAGISAGSSSHALLEREIDRLMQWADNLKARDGVPDEEWDRWGNAEHEVLKRVEDLSLSAENIRIKMKALLMIYEGDLSDMEAETTDMRLVRQVLLTIAA